MAKRSNPLARQGYHHGNLKEALVAAARRLIAERGPAGFSLVEAARLAGVSPAAPYRHFKDREALIAEVAQRGFAAFAGRLAAAWSLPEADAKQGFARMGEAYLAFAREEPGYYGAMFAPGGVQSGPPRSGDNAFGGLERMIARVTADQNKDGGRPAADQRIIAFQVWALAHGIATLSAAGQFPANQPALRPEALLLSGVAAMVAGALTDRAHGATRSAGPALRRKSGHGPNVRRSR